MYIAPVDNVNILTKTEIFKAFAVSEIIKITKDFWLGDTEHF